MTRNMPNEANRISGLFAAARGTDGFRSAGSTYHGSGRIVAAALLAAFVAMPVAADGRWGGDRGYSRADADIESLDATLRLSSIGAELIVRYDIEIEDARYGERFNLLLEIEQCDGLVRDATGRPVLLVVPLNNPSDVDDDELEFEDADTLSVPAPRDMAKLRNTRLIATVVRAGSDRPLDQERENLRVEFRQTRGRTWSGWQPPPQIRTVREVTQTREVRREVTNRRVVRHTRVVRR